MIRLSRFLLVALLLISCKKATNPSDGVNPPTPAVTDRTVVVEMFTNSGCPPCKPANEYFDGWLATYANKNQVAVIKYHAWWPDPNDPFYKANKQQAEDRNTYYSNSYVPHVFVDGSVDGSSSYSSWQSYIEGRMGISPLLLLTVTVNSGTSNKSISIVVQCPAAAPNGTLILHTIIVESNIAYTGSNGETAYNEVMRQMLPGSDGEEFTISSGESKMFTRSITWNANWVLTSSEIVIFVQSKSTNEIIQGARIQASSSNVNL